MPGTIATGANGTSTGRTTGKLSFLSEIFVGVGLVHNGEGWLAAAIIG